VTVEVGYRVADWDTPLWVNPNRSPSRWWTPGAIVQYWSLHPLTPWRSICEGERPYGRRSRGDHPAAVGG
jgi:hypothetical protein